MATLVERFHDFCWHDASLSNITIDRSNPGYNDVVLLDLEWPDGTKQSVEFTECYGFAARMNFGIIANESILDATCFADSPQLDEERRSWKKMGVVLDDLHCFEILTSSTGGTIRIFAKDFRVVE